MVARGQGPPETAREAPGAVVMGPKEEPKGWPPGSEQRSWGRTDALDTGGKA